MKFVCEYYNNNYSDRRQAPEGPLVNSPGKAATVSIHPLSQMIHLTPSKLKRWAGQNFRFSLDAISGTLFRRS